MDLLKEIKEYVENDDRTPSEQLSFIKRQGIMMMASPRLYKDHVVTFCGSLIKLYENLSGETKHEKELLKCEEITCRT